MCGMESFTDSNPKVCSEGPNTQLEYSWGLKHFSFTNSTFRMISDGHNGLVHISHNIMQFQALNVSVLG